MWYCKQELNSDLLVQVSIYKINIMLPIFNSFLNSQLLESLFSIFNLSVVFPQALWTTEVAAMRPQCHHSHYSPFLGSQLSPKSPFPRKSPFPDSHLSQEVTFPGMSHFPGSRISWAHKTYVRMSKCPNVHKIPYMSRSINDHMS